MIGGLTYVFISDNDEAVTIPIGDSGPIQFADYNEAMSYARFLSVRFSGTNGNIWVWNWNGGSGYWRNNAFSARDNANYPTP
jgi:hypothetical protein